MPSETETVTPPASLEDATATEASQSTDTDTKRSENENEGAEGNSTQVGQVNTVENFSPAAAAETENSAATEEIVASDEAVADVELVADEELSATDDTEPEESATTEPSADSEDQENTDASLGGEADANGEASESAESDEAAAKKPSIVARTKRLVLSNIKPIVASAASLLLGFCGSLMLGSNEETDLASIEPTVEKPRYVASITRRNEPIGPLVPFSGLDEHVVELGKRLFHDPGLSGNGRVACATCHVIEKGGGDGLQYPVGADHHVGTKNTLTVLNAAFNFVQFWDGRVETLEEQIDGPLLSKDEMNSDWERILKYVTSDERYRTAFIEHLGGEPNEQRVREAIATYERSLVTPNSAFDHWLAGDEKALNGDQYGGYYLFKKMNCLGCHNGAAVGGNVFQRLGAMKDYFTADNPARQSDLGRFLVTGEERDRYVFRVPSLRNVELTAPYFHDGSAETLEEAVSLMIEYQVGLDANPEDVRRIVAFLESLTGELPN